MEIVCLGEVLIDMFPAELGRRLAEVTAFYPKPGGAPANVAVAAARLGRDAAFIGKVGDEAFGRYLVEVLSQEGVDTSGMRLDAQARTGLAFIAQPDENTSEFVFYRNPGADMRLRADELDLSLLGSTKVFHFGSISLIQEPSRGATLEAIRVAKKAGALISFDVNYRPTLWPTPDLAREQVRGIISLVDLVKVNEAELGLLTGCARCTVVDETMLQDDQVGDAAAALLSLGSSICVVTLGPEGSYFRLGQYGERAAPFRVETVDATGCGDAFVAGLLSQFVMLDDWRRDLSPAWMRGALRYANAVGALTSMARGVIPALPTADRVEQFLETRR